MTISDGRLDTDPLFTMMLLPLRFVGATWNVAHQVLQSDKPDRKA
jgi:hypothetical protein